MLQTDAVSVYSFSSVDALPVRIRGDERAQSVFMPWILSVECR